MPPAGERRANDGHTRVFSAAAIAADHALASQAGVRVLREGGNAIDAAVATSFALSVVRPYSCGVGGGGFLLARLAGTATTPARTVCIDYREVAPRGLTPDAFGARAHAGPTPPDPATGGLAIGVPGQVAGMAHALERYGTMPLERVLEPALALAREGFAIDAHYTAQCADALARYRAWSGHDLSAAPAGLLRDTFFAQGITRAVGERLRLDGQARLFDMLAREGWRAFYDGPIADALVHAARRAGGVLEHADLREYRVVEREAFAVRWRGRTVLTVPPPSSGGIVLAQVLGMLDALGDAPARARARGWDDPEWIHLLACCCQHAFADRARWLGDPAFIDVPIGALLDSRALARAAGAIDPARALRAEACGVLAPGELAAASHPPHGHGTSHFSVADGAGNVVACTETINLEFGSLVGVDELGFMLNNTIDDFAARADRPNAFGLLHADRNAPAPGKRPLSSMTPTIVLEGDSADAHASPVLALGGSGGPRIISGVLQVMLHVLMGGDDATRALARPRFHHQWQPDTLQLEEGLLGTHVAAALAQRGHTITRRQPIAAVQVLRRDVRESAWDAASDPRKGGAPAGL